MITGDDYPDLYRKVLLYVSARIPHPDCEDVTSDIILAIYKANFRGESSPETFQFSIMKRKVIDWIRRKVKEKEVLERCEMRLKTLPDFERLSESREVMDRFWEGLSVLNERQCRVIKLFYFDDVPISDIADQMGYSGRWVSQTKNLSLRKLFVEYVRRTNEIKNSKRIISSREGSRTYT